MALIRGVRGLCPCPICLVRNTKLSDVHTICERRTADTAQSIVEDTTTSKTEKDEQLKPLGLRCISVRNTSGLTVII